MLPNADAICCMLVLYLQMPTANKLSSYTVLWAVVYIIKNIELHLRRQFYVSFRLETLAANESGGTWTRRRQQPSEPKPSSENLQHCPWTNWNQTKLSGRQLTCTNSWSQMQQRCQPCSRCLCASTLFLRDCDNSFQVLLCTNTYRGSG